MRSTRRGNNCLRRAGGGRLAVRAGDCACSRFRFVFLRDEIAKAIPSFSKIPVSEQLVGLFTGSTLLHFVVGSGRERRAAGEDVTQSEEHDCSAAGEVGGLGNGARRHSIHIALCSWSICLARRPIVG